MLTLSATVRPSPLEIHKLWGSGQACCRVKRKPYTDPSPNYGMAEEQKKADALAHMSGVIKALHEDYHKEQISTEALIIQWNKSLDEHDVESDTLYLEA